MLGVAGKRVLISGGCGDIGRAVANRFLCAGAKVMLVDRLPEEQGLETARALHPSATYFRCDVGQRSSVEETVGFAVKHLGGIDVAISNAGVVFNAPVLELDERSWQDTLQVNLTGSFYFGQATARAMLRNDLGPRGVRGVILFTESWVQHMPWPHGASYCVSKSGQEMLMKVMAQELAAHQITCNIVAPGIVYAGLSKTIYDQDEQYRRLVDHTVPLGRLSTADEVAGSFLFLASDDGSYITGTTLLVDGGASLVRRESSKSDQEMQTQQ